MICCVALGNTQVSSSRRAGLEHIDRAECLVELDEAIEGSSADPQLPGDVLHNGSWQRPFAVVDKSANRLVTAATLGAARCLGGVGPIGRNVVHPDLESKRRSRAGISR